MKTISAIKRTFRSTFWHLEVFYLKKIETSLAETIADKFKERFKNHELEIEWDILSYSNRCTNTAGHEFWWDAPIVYVVKRIAKEKEELLFRVGLDVGIGSIFVRQIQGVRGSKYLRHKLRDWQQGVLEVCELVARERRLAVVVPSARRIVRGMKRTHSFADRRRIVQRYDWTAKKRGYKRKTKHSDWMKKMS